MKQVGQKAPEAVAGANQLADGSEKVAAGANALAAGLNYQLAPGADQLAAGLGSLTQAADGAQQLSDGLAQAEDGNQQIVDGTGKLSARGSKKLIAAGDKTARTFARQYAIMKALDEKGAKNGMPYGTPTGLQDNRAAYDLTVAAVGHSGSTSNPAGHHRADRPGCRRVPWRPPCGAASPEKSGRSVPTQTKIAVPGMSRPRSGDQPPHSWSFQAGHSGSTRSTSRKPAATISRTRSPSVRWCST